MGEQAVLHEAIRATADPMALMDRIVAQALLLVPAADGASLEIRCDIDTLEYLSTAGTLAPFTGLQLSLNQSLSGLAVVTGDVQLCHDGLDDARVNREAVAKTGVRSMLCVPLSSQEGCVAVLKVSARRPHAFVQGDVERLGIIAQFLEAIVTSASRLAAVTARVLSDLEVLELDTSGTEDVAGTARFVANVMTPGLVDRIEVAAAVREVIDHDRLEIVLQPIVDLASGSIVACEALSRFHGTIQKSPDWWFSAAHRVGLGVQLEELALRKALSTLAHVPSGVRMAVNVGVDLLLQPAFERIFDGHPLGQLTIELTEHDNIRDYSSVVQAVEGMRAQGAGLSVDDTGSGYSGLTHILKLRPNVIKLDRELVTGLHEDPAKQALASALVRFAGSLNARVVAEGIEQTAEAECLIGIGIGLGQGYLYGRPMPPRKFAELVLAP